MFLRYPSIQIIFSIPAYGHDNNNCNKNECTCPTLTCNIEHYRVHHRLQRSIDKKGPPRGALSDIVHFLAALDPQFIHINRHKIIEESSNKL